MEQKSIKQLTTEILLNSRTILHELDESEGGIIREKWAIEARLRKLLKPTYQEYDWGNVWNDAIERAIDEVWGRNNDAD